MSAEPSSRRRPAWGLAFQFLLVAAGLALAAGYAGESGATLLVPIGSQARAALPALALDGHSRLIAAGLFPGSLVVRRTGAATPLFTHGILAVPVPLRACGSGATA